MRKIFIDGGAHLGESVVMFRKEFDVNNEFEYYMFEPNLKLFNIFKDKFQDCHHYNVALTAKNENGVKLWGGDNSHEYIDNNGVTQHECGATLNECKRKRDDFSDNEYSLVDTIRLSEFIDKEFNDEDEIVLKLDVEGSEYDIFEDLLATGTIKKISKIYCEFHSEKLRGPLYEEYKIREQKIIKELKTMNLEPDRWNALI